MKKLVLRFLTIMMVVALLSCMTLTAFAATCTVNGCELTYSSKEIPQEDLLDATSLYKHHSTDNKTASATWDGANERFVLTAGSSTYKSTGGIFSKHYYYAQNYMVTMTMTNATSNALRIQYTVSGIMDSHVAGTYTTTLRPNSENSLTFTLASKETNSEAKESTTYTGYVTIDDIFALENVDVKFASSSRGSYTYQVSGDASETSVAKDGEVSATRNLKWGTEVTLTQGTADSGYKFYGWMASGKLLGTVDGTYAIEDDAVIYPVYLPEATLSGTALYKVGSNNYWIWSAAFADAKSSGNTVVVNGDHTLPTMLEDAGLCAANTTSEYVAVVGDTVKYIVPYGCKLLVPYGSSDGGSFGSEPTNYISAANGIGLYDNGGMESRNFAYRTLTVPGGVKIDCYGQINVNGQRQNDGQPYSGVVLGGYGKIALNGAENEEQLTIYSNAKLFAYGYITGTGLVNISSGGTLHELIQVCDWPGGSNATNWTEAATKNVSLFPLSQYYVQNVEADLKFNSGASAAVEAVLTASGSSQTVSAAYVGTDNGLFKLKSGYVIRRYSENADRMNYYLHGTVDIGYLEIKKTFLGIEIINLNSSNYVLPLPNNMTITIAKDSVLNMDKKIALMPGSELKVENGGTVNLSGQIYIVDVADWSRTYYFNRAEMRPVDGSTSSYVYANTSADFAPVPYVATLDTISPRTTALVRGSTVDKDGTVTQQYYMKAVDCSDSGKLTVDGTLNVTGTVSTTKANSSTNKVVVGTGIINYSATPNVGSLKGGYSSTIQNMTTTYGLANIAGVGTLKPLAQGTYYGQPNGYWYNYLVKADTAENAAKYTFGDTNLSGTTLSRYNGTATEEISNVVALVGSSWSDSASVQTKPTFSVEEGTTIAMSSTGNIPAISLSGTGYSLNNFDSDVTLGIGEKPTVVGFVASNAKPALFKTLSVAFPADANLGNYYSDNMLGTAAGPGNIGGVVYTNGGEAVAAIGYETRTGDADPVKGAYTKAFMKVNEAVAAATGDETYVTVLKDRPLTDPIVIAADQNITLDLGGKTLDGGSNKAKEPLTNNGILRLINGTITYKAAYRTGSDGKGDMSQELMTATVRNNGTIEYIDNVTLEEMYSSASVYVTPLMNCTGATIKEIRSGSFVGTSMSNGGVGIMNFGTINTIGANEEEITFYNRRGIVCAKGTISTIGGAGSTIKITHGQRGVETFAAGTITTIGADRSKIEIINDASHKMVKSGIYSAGTIGTIGGKGSSIDISINVTATHIYANYGINIASGSVGVIGDSESVITITGTTAQNLDTAYSIYGLWNYKGTITTLGAAGSQIYVNVSHTGNGDAYGIMNQKTVETLGASGSVIEVVSNKYGIYNSESISSLGGDLVAVSTDTTGSYYALYNAGTITSINSGDYYHASGRANAVYNPDSQKYPAGYDLSTTTRNVALVDGSHYPCYYLAKSGAGIITGEEPGGAPATPENQGILGDIIADYLELSESERNDSYIVLTQNCDEPTSIALTGDVYLDLNGHNADLTGFDLNGHNLYVIDSATNAYLTNDGDQAGHIIGFDGVSAIHTSDRGASRGKHYVQVAGESGGLEFHRAAVSVTTIQYTPGQDYAVFQGVFRGTSDVVTALKDVGFRFNGENDVWYNMTDKKATAIYDMPFSYACKLEGVDSVQALLSFAEEPTAASMIVSTLRAGIADLIKGASE